MSSDDDRRRLNTGSLVTAIVLIVLGGFILLLQIIGPVLDLDLGHYLWPFFVIVPGFILLVVGLTIAADGGPGLTVAGSVVTMVGVLLFFQNLTGWWATWAYAWALVAPTAPGIGLILYGAVTDQSRTISDGLRLVTIGLILFAVLGVFFELIIGISGFGLGRLGVVCGPVLLIGAGALILLRGLFRSRKV